MSKLGLVLTHFVSFDVVFLVALTQSWSVVQEKLHRLLHVVQTAVG